MLMLVQKIMRTSKRLQTKQLKRVKDRPVSKYQLKNPEPIIVEPYQLKQIRTNPASLRALGLENKLIFMYVNLSDKPVRLDPN